LQATVRNSISLSSAKHLPARKRGGYAVWKRWRKRQGGVCHGII